MYKLNNPDIILNIYISPANIKWIKYILYKPHKNFDVFF